MSRAARGDGAAEVGANAGRLGGPAGRIAAIVLRHVYLLRRSWPRIVEMMFWPTLSVVMWAFISQYLRGGAAGIAVQLAASLLAAVMLWEVLIRSQMGINVAFLEEMWSRNLGHLFVTPLRSWEWIAGLVAISVLRTFVSLLPVTLLVIPFFGFNLYAELGLPLVAFFLNLLAMGWWIGLLLVALILRNGLGAEALAWMAVFALAPFAAIYYPIAVLPVWLQPVSWALPAAHVFEGLRALLFERVVAVDHLLWATGLNLAGLALGVVVLSANFRAARRSGALLQMGE